MTIRKHNTQEQTHATWNVKDVRTTSMNDLKDVAYRTQRPLGELVSDAIDAYIRMRKFDVDYKQATGLDYNRVFQDEVKEAGAAYSGEES